jgi:hypothetical protein
LLNSPWIYATRHYSNFKGDLQKDTDFMTASSPESLTNIQRLPERNRKLPREMEQVDADNKKFVNVKRHYFIDLCECSTKSTLI